MTATATSFVPDTTAAKRLVVLMNARMLLSPKVVLSAFHTPKSPPVAASHSYICPWKPVWAGYGGRAYVTATLTTCPSGETPMAVAPTLRMTVSQSLNPVLVTVAVTVHWAASAPTAQSALAVMFSADALM